MIGPIDYRLIWQPLLASAGRYFRLLLFLRARPISKRRGVVREELPRVEVGSD
jgi:hypothetical protein